MSENEAIKTAFHEVIAAQGGSHVEDGGWMWLEGFGDVAKEYAAIRDDVAVWDVSPLNKWEFRGPDALRAAQRVFSNDALGLEVGQVRYGAFLDPDGLMVDDGTVFNTAREDHCWVMTNGRDHEEYFGEAVAGPRRGVRVDHAVDAAPRRDRSALARGRPEAHRRGHRVAEVLPVRPAAGQGRRRGRAPVADRVRRRARVRAVPARPRRRRDPLERGRRRGRDAVRHRRDRGRPGRGRADRHRLRLRAARAHAVRLQPRPDGAARPGARFRRRGRAARRGRGPAQPLRHAALRGRRRSPSTARRSRRTARRSESSRARPTARGSARSGSP